MVARHEETFLSYANNKDADQPVHPHSESDQYLYYLLDTSR